MSGGRRQGRSLRFTSAPAVMCLPFLCGGHDRDHGETPHAGIQQHPHQPPLSDPPLSPPPPPPRYVTTPPLKSYDNGDDRPPAGTMVAGGEAKKNRTADEAPWHVAENKNGEHMRAFDTTDAGVDSSPAIPLNDGSYPKASADKMRAPPEAQMAHGVGAEGDYPTAAATTPSPAANNFYGGDYAYGRDNNRKPQGNSWW